MKIFSIVKYIIPFKSIGAYFYSRESDVFDPDYSPRCVVCAGTLDISIKE